MQTSLISSTHSGTIPGCVYQWVSDQGPHFKNEVVNGVRSQLRGNHHFTLPYFTVEVVWRELQRCTKALLSEFMVASKIWPSVVSMVQSALNNAHISRLGGRCPLKAFTAFPSNSPLASIESNMNGKVETLSISAARKKQIMQVNSVLTAFESMKRRYLGLLHA